MDTPSPTAAAAPWALVRYGGRPPQHRPSTRLAWIVQAVAHDGQIVGYEAYTYHASQDTWSQAPRRVAPEDLLATWRSRPSVTTQERVRQRHPL
jgi:hypothetical protein